MSQSTLHGSLGRGCLALAGVVLEGVQDMRPPHGDGQLQVLGLAGLVQTLAQVAILHLLPVAGEGDLLGVGHLAPEDGGSVAGDEGMLGLLQEHRVGVVRRISLWQSVGKEAAAQVQASN